MKYGVVLNRSSSPLIFNSNFADVSYLLLYQRFILATLTNVAHISNCMIALASSEQIALQQFSVAMKANDETDLHWKDNDKEPDLHAFCPGSQRRWEELSTSCNTVVFPQDCDRPDYY